MNQINQNQQQKTFQETKWLTPNFENIPNELKSQPWGGLESRAETRSRWRANRKME